MAQLRVEEVPVLGEFEVESFTEDEDDPGWFLPDATFETSKSECREINLDKYLDRMQEGQAVHLLHVGRRLEHHVGGSGPACLQGEGVGGASGVAL